MSLLLQVQTPVLSDADDFQSGLWSVHPLGEGLSFSLSFAQAYEPFFIVGNERVSSDHSVEHTPHALWLYRELFGLYDRLGTQYGVLGNIVDGHYQAHSLLRLPERELLNVAKAKALLHRSPIKLAPSFTLAPCEDRESLRLLAFERCPNPPVELRLEVDGEVILRTRPTR